MESTGTLQTMSLPENLRPKQREIIEAFKQTDYLIAKLPTGYGKTLAAAGSYAVLRHRGACNRMLYVVPRSSQARQAAESVPSDLSVFGVKTKAIEIGRDPINSLRRHRDGSCEVFVTTVQALSTSPATSRTVADLVETGRWFVVVDEHHHYGEETTWADVIKALPSRAMLAMSATPNRHDGSDHFSDPHIVETYRGAAKAGYVKQLTLHAYDYIVDALTKDGKAIPFTTEQIVQEAGSDSPEVIDKFMLAQKMRWSPKYISPLVTYPLDRIISLRTRNVRSQMLVQAMSCTHAEMVCEQIRSLLPENLTVDWVGTGPSGRSDRDNEAVLRAFCPEKDQVTGRRNWTLDVLVNVGIASEGLDTTDVAEIVFLTPANITITNLQTIGRGARLIPGLKTQPQCHVNVDTGSPMADFIGARVMDLFDDINVEEREEQEEKDARERLEDDYEPLPETMSVMIVDVRLTDIRKGALWEEALRIGIESASAATPREQIEQAVEAGLTRFLNRSNNVSSVLAQKREKVNNGTTKISHLVLRRIAQTGVRVEKSLAGDLRRRINTQKKRLFGCVNEADEEQLDRQYAWLREVEKQILNDQGLQGVPTWLR